MALQSEREELQAAWRALAGHPESEGWRTIPIARKSPCKVLAGRHFPGNEEALLVGFAPTRLPPPNLLPQGRGFLVSREEVPGQPGHVWVALRRQQAGRLDLFAMMALDVLGALEQLSDASNERLVEVFLSRIAAWQEFMRRDSDGVLSPEAEVGLTGELELLNGLLDSNLPAPVALQAWQGPLDGLHDFTFGTGAIEVKSTISPAGFPAKISSLDQLDDTIASPLFVAGVRLALDSAGNSLPDMVSALRTRLAESPSALVTFNTRLLHAGYLDDVADRYTRRFTPAGTRFLVVSDRFPRLTRATTPAEIRTARYELDLELISGIPHQLDDVLAQLGLTE